MWQTKRSHDNSSEDENSDQVKNDSTIYIELVKPKSGARGLGVVESPIKLPLHISGNFTRVL